MDSSTKIRRDGGSTRGGVSSDQNYFRWLTTKVQEEGHPRNTYRDLFWILYDTEFIWKIPNDDNRVADGLELRRKYLRETGRQAPDENMRPCSVLEVIVGLSCRLAWLADGSEEGWAWQLLCNLELHKFRDPLSKRRIHTVEEILYALIWRTYEPDGTGGFFPLMNPREDQRKVEIWYQMNAYALEIHPEY